MNSKSSRNRVAFFALIFCSLMYSVCSVAQLSAIYTEENSLYRAAQELFDKGKYSAAQEQFNATINTISNKQDETRINAEYYCAVCALRLFHKDAEHLLNQFLFYHPDHPKSNKIYFQLGRYHYRSKKFQKSLEYLKKVDRYDLLLEELPEYYFKLGYCYFMEDQMGKAKVQFHEIISAENDYWAPANYYFAHIAYTENNYQTALEGFEKIATDPMFGGVVPYYVAQIYHKQEKYDELLGYAPAYLDKISKKRKPEFSKLIGDAHYYKKQYTNALPHLKFYHKSTHPSREEYYQLGYTYYQTKDYLNAITSFGRVGTQKDALGQAANYHLADAYLKTEQKNKAKNAFLAASKQDFDLDVQKNALYNYAKLAFELSNNPFDEAIKAFHLFIDNYPDDSKKEEAYEYLLKVYMTTKNYDAALANLEKIDTKDHRIKRAYQSVSFNRGVQRYHNAQYQGAVEDFKNALKYSIEPLVNAESRYWMAGSYYKMGQYDKAITHFNAFKKEQGAALSNSFYNADYNIGYAYFLKASPFDILADFKNDAVKKKHNNLLKESATAFRNFIVLKDRIAPDKLQDTYLRLADCYYLLKEDNQAVNYYAIAIKNGKSDMSYAYYQKARSHGTLGEHEAKAATLEELSEKYPNSSYKISALKDLAGTYMFLGENDKAISTYLEFIRKYPENNYVPGAYANVASIYARTQDYANARKYALQVLDEFPNSKEENDKVLQTMKIVYNEEGNIAGYYDWLATRGIQVKPGEMDFVLWEPVESAFEKGNCEEVKMTANTYLTQVSNPTNDIAAHFYLAQCHFEDNKDKALEHYNFVIAKPNNQFYEEALQFGSYIAFEQQDYITALSHYNKLENSGVKQENIRTAIIAQMHCHYELGHYKNTIAYSNKVAQLSPLERPIEVESILIKGLSLKNLTQYEEALIQLKKCYEMTQSIKGAEAKYNYAHILHTQENYEECEVIVLELIKRKPSYEYWLAKAVILLSKNYMEVEDYFNAKHALQSIISNYNGPDNTVIIDEAKGLAEEIRKLEN